ncbi:MAG: hypothetical protein Q8934_10530 [Bacillota bacterium]|nr:hypothetical protein [Bacillota bacterium]
MVELISDKIEFRGIPLSCLGMYFEELGGIKITKSFPILYEGTDWRAEILYEDELMFTSIFKVNRVCIRFSAETSNTLDELIKNYRYKTTRIGG